jgi:hypothetical protein
MHTTAEHRAYRRDIPGLALIYDDFEPWYTRAERLYQVHDNAVEDPSGPSRFHLAQPGWHRLNGVKGQRLVHHLSRMPRSRAWVIAWLREEAPSLR